MHCIRAALAFITLAANAQAEISRAPETAPATLAQAEQLILHSQFVKRDFLIQVSFPERIRPGEKAAALYVLDGNVGFGLLTDSVRLLHPGGVATTYVVAIGYPKVHEAGDLRDTDLAHVRGTIRGLRLGGGGAAFERFILEELRPLIESRYPIDPEKSVLLGHSLGGLFATTVLANRPEAFSGYLISSPSLQFDPSLLDRVARIASRGKGRRVYVSVGSEEGPVALPAAQGLHAALTGPGSTFEMRYCKVQGYYHMSVTLTLASVALPFLLPPPPVSNPPVMRVCPSSIIGQ